MTESCRLITTEQYQEWKASEKKLAIAVKVLEEYAEEENWDDCSTGEFGSIPNLWFKSAYKNEHFGYNEAKKALKQIKELDK